MLLAKPPIIIAGNGSSITRINYKKIPNHHHTFRVNNFYFEDIYYLGKIVDFYLCGVALLEHQFFNINYLNTNHEYHIKNFYINNHHNLYKTNNYATIFPDVHICNTMIEKIPYLQQQKMYYEYYYNHYLTAGTIALMTAIGMGYKEFYITGIDFYDQSISESSYPFKLGQNFINIRHEKYNIPLDKMTSLNSNCHNIIFEKQIIKDLAANLDIKLYSISDSSIEEIIPIAPDIRSDPYIPERKEKEYLNDWLILPKDRVAPPKISNIRKILQQLENYLKNNRKKYIKYLILYILFIITNTIIILLTLFFLHKY